jgi:hypothetical protein
VREEEKVRTRGGEGIHGVKDGRKDILGEEAGEGEGQPRRQACSALGSSPGGLLGRPIAPAGASLEGPVAVQRLTHKLGVVHSRKGRRCLLLSLVLNQRKTLRNGWFSTRSITQGDTAYLDEAGTPVQRHLQVLDLPKISKLVMQVVFLSLLMHTSNKDDPSLNS